VFNIDKTNPILEAPVYSFSDAASYARVPYQTLRYWVVGRKDHLPPLIQIPEHGPVGLSFLNLLECHVLNALRTKYELQIKAVRRALETLARIAPSRHPLLETTLSTDKIDLFFESAEDVINLSRGGQTAMKEVLLRYLERIESNETGIPKFFPFVYKDQAHEPRIISIVPTVAFGRSVIDGTGISTAVVAARFNARESIEALAEEYGRSPGEIQEAVIWENNRTAAAA
jgi:uncharacterized protein (DUF433 family)